MGTGKRRGIALITFLQLSLSLSVSNITYNRASISGLLQVTELEDSLRALFPLLDKDNDGRVSLEEMKVCRDEFNTKRPTQLGQMVPDVVELALGVVDAVEAQQRADAMEEHIKIASRQVQAAKKKLRNSKGADLVSAQDELRRAEDVVRDDSAALTAFKQELNLLRDAVERRGIGDKDYLFGLAKKLFDDGLTLQDVRTAALKGAHGGRVQADEPYMNERQFYPSNKGGEDTNRVPVLSLLNTSCFPPTDTAQDQGPWRGAAVPQGLMDRCDIAQETATLSREDFKRKYFDTKLPVMVRGAAAEWAALKEWSTLDRLTARYGDSPMWVGQRPPMLSRLNKLSEFIEYMRSPQALRDPRPSYLWDNAMSWAVLNGTNKRHPVEDTEVPGFMLQLPVDVLSMSFTMGGACTGSHMHKHNHAFCSLIAGLKYWLLVAPKEYSKNPKGSYEPPVDRSDDQQGYHPRDFIASMANRRGAQWWVNRTPGMLECTQRPGDVIYVPISYLHLIVNLWPSTAVNHEFQQPGVEEVDDPNERQEAQEGQDEEQRHHESLANTCMLINGWTTKEQLVSMTPDKKRRVVVQGLFKAGKGTKAALLKMGASQLLRLCGDGEEDAATAHGEKEAEQIEFSRCEKFRSCEVCRTGGCAWCVLDGACMPEGSMSCRSQDDEVGTQGKRQTCGSAQRGQRQHEDL